MSDKMKYNKCLKCGKLTENGRILIYLGIICNSCKEQYKQEIDKAYNEIYSGLWGSKLRKQIALMYWSKILKIR